MKVYALRMMRDETQDMGRGIEQNATELK